MKQCIPILAILLFCSLCSTSVHAQFSNSPCNRNRAEDFGEEDPRNPQAVCFPEVGRMQLPSPYPADLSNNLIALGDINHDSIDDWAARILYGGDGQQHLHIYFGQRGKLPAVTDRQYIGPTELESQTTLLAHGDWDNDGNVDLCCRIQISGDTSFGNVTHFDIAQCVVFWGQDSGKYSINDTTRLSNGIGAWGGPWSGCSFDADGDSLRDLILRDGGSAMSGGKWLSCPKFIIYKGSRSQRWGRNGVSAKADFIWWNVPMVGDLVPMDQDSDGNMDIGFLISSEQGTGFASVLYGRKNTFPDTATFERIDLLISNGHYVILTDVTGDKIPELIINSGSEERLKVYIGIRGQRLKEQYGTGIDPAPLDSQRWWGRPWVMLRQALAINAGWGNSFGPLWSLGDANMDGISDIYTISDPYLICYSGGRFLDEYIDGLVDLRPLGTPYVSVARLGNILGDGKDVIAIRNGSGLVLFVQVSKNIPKDGLKQVRFPDGTLVGIKTEPRIVSYDLQLKALPNPSTGKVLLNWKNPDLKAVQLSITDLNGKSVLTVNLPASTSIYQWQPPSTLHGVYYVEVMISSNRQTLQLQLP